MPLPAADSDMPENLTQIANEMERTDITNDHWYQVQESWWAAMVEGGGSDVATETPDG